MKKSESQIKLIPLEDNDRDQFIKDNQYAFLYGATQEFGMRDDHFEEDGEIISRKTIEQSLDRKNSQPYRIVLDGKKVGGVVLNIDRENQRGELELLFVSPDVHSMGIGYATWCKVEKMYREIKVWETFTPYFEKRNIHFYVNRCGFHIVEFYNSYHKDNNEKADGDDNNVDDFDGMFRFEKVMDR
ncbi:MAG: GNAT family N-acetyltransferase [Lachnospiraceae bacterium]|nr:GNAT family N-acetyltransferase [Lachnospiraceae bacterium]